MKLEPKIHAPSQIRGKFGLEMVAFHGALLNKHNATRRNQNSTFSSVVDS